MLMINLFYSVCTSQNWKSNLLDHWHFSMASCVALECFAGQYLIYDILFGKF